MTALLCVLSFAGGVALCWFGKDKVIVMVSGAEAFARKLDAKVRAIRATL